MRIILFFRFCTVCGKSRWNFLHLVFSSSFFVIFSFFLRDRRLRGQIPIRQDDSSSREDTGHEEWMTSLQKREKKLLFVRGLYSISHFENETISKYCKPHETERVRTRRSQLLHYKRSPEVENLFMPSLWTYNWGSENCVGNVQGLLWSCAILYVLWHFYAFITVPLICTQCTVYAVNIKQLLTKTLFPCV
jgi:hypothetical protein